MFLFNSLIVNNFRGFEFLELPLDEELTVLFAENGGGKTSLLTALAMGMAVFQPRSPRELKLDALRDPRKVPVGNRRQREDAGPCTVAWVATVGVEPLVDWEITVNPASGRLTQDTARVLSAIESVRLPGKRWPLFAWYGTDRLRAVQRRGTRTVTTLPDRWEGYASSLSPTLTDGPLLEWLEREILGDLMRHRQGEPERRLDEVVMNAMVRATPDIVEAWYDPIERGPVTRFRNGYFIPWSELSDGFHVFLALVGDIARRAVVLNEADGTQAPELIEGVVIIDEIDLHLHPRWQRVVLDGIRTAFPKLQFIVTTHSPQVLSSAKNHQVRHLNNWTLDTGDVFVEGRDSNAILRDLMGTDDRDEAGRMALRALYKAIDQNRREDAERLHAALVLIWGDLDPEIIRARGFMDWEDEN